MNKSLVIAACGQLIASRQTPVSKAPVSTHCYLIYTDITLPKRRHASYGHYCQNKSGNLHLTLATTPSATALNQPPTHDISHWRQTTREMPSSPRSSSTRSRHSCAYLYINYQERLVWLNRNLLYLAFVDGLLATPKQTP